MPKLILSVDDKIIDEFNIDKDIVTIGRRADNDICLDNLAISGYHTQITTVLNDSFLEDLNSTNGTFVNSKIVKKHALKDGDLIDIGNHRIKYINHLATSSANSDFEKTVVMTPKNDHKNIDESIADLENEINTISNFNNKSKDEPIEDDDIYDDIETDSTENEITKKEPQAENKPAANNVSLNTNSEAYQTGHIQILNGSNCGKELILDKTLTTLGKPDIAIVGITKRNSGYYIVHIDSKNGHSSKLNGEIIKGRAQPLSDHDIIDVAGIKLEFFLEQ